MDTLTIIFTFLLTPTLVIGTIIIVEQVKRGKLKINLDKSFRILLRKYNLALDDVHFFRKKAIGIDKEKQKLIFLDKNKPLFPEMCISLNDFSFCVIREKKDPHSNAVQIFLELVARRHSENVQLNFFDQATDTKYVKTQLVHKAEFWKNKINHLINRKKSYRGHEFVI